MKMLLKILSTIMTAMLLACNSDSALLPERDLVVVRAYLYANEPVTDVQLTTTYPITSDTTAGLPINDAAVSLEKNGQSYPLIASAGDSGYYHYPGGDLQVDVGDVFTINVEYQGEFTTAETTIPQPPNAVTISENELVIETPTGFPGRGGLPFDTSSVTVNWQAEDDAFFFVIIEALEEELTPINEGRFGFFARGIRAFRSRPTRNNQYPIRQFDLAYLGDHQVRVYKVNQEYADLYAFGL